MTTRLYLDLLRNALVNRHYQHLVTAEWSSQLWSKTAYTGIDVEGLDNIRDLLEDVIFNSVPGDFLEAGVWQGGASIFAAGILLAHHQLDRKVWLLDSFEGMPRPNVDCPQETVDYSDMKGLAVSLDEVQQNFERFGLFGFARFVQGWLKDTLPTFDCPTIAVLRLDNDYYESTKLCLEKFYDCVPVGGYVIVDDYDCVPGCNLAVDEFLRSRSINPVLNRMNPRTNTGIYWQKR